jgi:molybdopterin-containing oxidoreductase family iron-sulfur binding subunit
VVGKDEVHRSRELAWIRIDRYYDESDGGFSVAHQPMMCHHCDNAPCETMCPVLATVHSEEGLNLQVYNRCIGTRYCSNNCPYKVRRFNWFQYKHGDERHKLVLNPDITVRDRGVMEKCTFCVQRIQEAKIEARNNGVPLKEGDIQPACAQSCPAQAIVFGDMNAPESELAKRMNDPRYYRVLEELGVEPSVGYMTMVKNRERERNV